MLLLLVMLRVRWVLLLLLLLLRVRAALWELLPPQRAWQLSPM